jgi:hypothetical protein
MTQTGERKHRTSIVEDTKQLSSKLVGFIGEENLVATANLFSDHVSKFVVDLKFGFFLGAFLVHMIIQTWGQGKNEIKMNTYANR